MTSQEGIELSRLMPPRSSDHHVTRAGATRRPVFATSTTESSSEPAEPGSTRPSPHHLPDSNYTIQHATGVDSTSNDKSPLIPDGEEIPRSPIGRRKTSIPWTLRRLPLLGLVTFLVVLIVALEVLYHFSNKNQGLMTASQDAAYLWKYLPTAILTTLAFYWNKLDYHTKALMPWKLMSEKPQLADQSLLLDYTSGNILTVLSSSVRHKHVPVITSTIGSLVIILITVFSTGLFVLQSIVLHEMTNVTVSSTFDGSKFRPSAVDSFPILVISSIFSGNLSIEYPPGTGVEYAVDKFSVETALDDLDPDASISGNVELFRADLDCNVGRANLTSLTFGTWTWKIEVDMTDNDCATGSTTIASPSVDHKAINILPIGKVIFKQCPGDNEPKLFVFYGQINASIPSTAFQYENLTYSESNGVVHSFDSAVLVCTPNHALQEALVTTDSAGALIDIGVPKTLNRTITSPWDLWSAFNTSLSAAAHDFLGNPTNNPRGGDLYDDFISALNEIWSRRPAEYTDYETLLRDSRRLYAATANQIASRFLRVDSTRLAPGSYKKTRLRVTLKDTAFRIVEAGLVLLIMCTCLVSSCSPCPPSPSTSATLASLAVMMHKTGQLRSRKRDSGQSFPSLVGDSPSGQSSALTGYESGRSDSTRLDDSETPATSIVTWWIPLAFSTHMKLVILTLPLAIVACLEATCQISRTRQGLNDAMENQYWHYVWTWIPASTMTLVSLLYSSITWSVALLDPYSILRTRSVAARHTLGQPNLSKPAIQLGHQGLRYKRYALLTAAVSALLAPFLTIFVSGLILVQPVQRTENLVMNLADHISSPTGKETHFTEWNPASIWAANLLYQGYGSYPRGTYRNFVFPNIVSDTRNATLSAGAKLLNATSIDVDVDVIMANVTCQVLDPNGFRYTVGINGSNDPSDTEPFWGWDGPPGDSWLNFTHVDLASLGCSDSDIHCDTIASVGVDLRANSTRFSHQIYNDNSWKYIWANPSAWPDGETLREAIAVRNETAPVSPDIHLFYGTWRATSAQVHGIACYYDIRQGRANVTYGLSTNDVATVSSVQPFIPSFVAVSDYHQALPWSGSLEHLEFLLSGGDLYQAVTNNNSEAFYDTPSGSIQLAAQTSTLFSHFFTQFYNIALRDQNFTADNINATATLHDPNFQRIFQSEISTRILEGLLLAMWLCACIVYYLFDTKTLLPKNPCSIAAQTSLLADSKFLDMIPEEAMNATLEELMQMTPFKDHLFSMGWWDDRNGGRRFGIDVGMADFDKGGDEGEKVEESGEVVHRIGDVEQGEAGKVDARVSMDIGIDRRQTEEGDLYSEDRRR